MSLIRFPRANAVPVPHSIDDSVDDDVDMLLLIAVRAALKAGCGGVRVAPGFARLDAALDVIA